MTPPTELTLSREAWHQACAHAIQHAPREAVGLIGGAHLAHGVRTYPLRNLVPEQGFLAEPWSQFVAERDLRQRGHCIAAIYHSHPDGTPTYSTEDVRYARAVPYLIIATTAHRCEAAAYWLVDTAYPMHLTIT